MNKPIIGITMGDASGVGPEIIVKSLAHTDILERCHPIVIGDLKMLERAAGLLQADFKAVKIDSDFNFNKLEDNKVYCYALDLIPDDLAYVEVSATAGDAAFQYLKTAIELADPTGSDFSRLSKLSFSI